MNKDFLPIDYKMFLLEQPAGFRLHFNVIFEKLDCLPHQP